MLCHFIINKEKKRQKIKDEQSRLRQASSVTTVVHVNYNLISIELVFSSCELYLHICLFTLPYDICFDALNHNEWKLFRFDINLDFSLFSLFLLLLQF